MENRDRWRWRRASRNALYEICADIGNCRVQVSPSEILTSVDRSIDFVDRFFTLLSLSLYISVKLKPSWVLLAIILRYSFAVIRLARQWSSICAIREVIKSDRDRCEEHINDLLSLLEFRSYSLPNVRDIIRFRTIDIDSGKLGFRVNFEKRKKGYEEKDYKWRDKIGDPRGGLYILIAKKFTADYLQFADSHIFSNIGPIFVLRSELRGSL